MVLQAVGPPKNVNVFVRPKSVGPSLLLLVGCYFIEAMNEGLPGLEVGVHYDTINLRTDIPENFLSEEDGSKQWRVGILHNVEVGSFSEPSLLIGVVMAFTNSPRYGDTDRKWKGTMFLLIELKHLTVINGKTDCQAAVVQFLRACTAVKIVGEKVI